MSPRWDTLPDDIFLDIARFLEVKDILTLRQTSRPLRDLTHLRSIWFHVLHTQVVQRGLPVPGSSNSDLDIFSLDANELERFVIRALRLHLNWTSASPQVRSRMHLPPSAVPGTAPRSRMRCLAVYFLPGRGNKHVIVLLRCEETLSATQRSYEVQCWDISHQPQNVVNDEIWTEGRCIAKYACTGLLAVCVNADGAHPACLTLTQHIEPAGHGITTFALSIDFNAPNLVHTADPETITFKQYNLFPSYQTAIRLQGSLFFATDETHEIRVINVDTGRLLYALRAPLFHADPTIFLEEYRCVNSLIIGDFALIFRQQWIHLYHLPRLSDHERGLLNNESDNEYTTLDPVAKYKWRWRIDTLDLIVQRPHPLSGHLSFSNNKDKKRPPSICILLRFASIFPWPVNMLHQYILPPNPSFDMNATESTDSPGHNVLPYLLPDSVNPEAIIPLSLRPYMVTSIPSPVRIFTPTDTAVGLYGTALWLDASTDVSAVSQAGDRGQRIAGRPLSFVPRPRGNSTDEGIFQPHGVDLEGANTDASELIGGEAVGDLGEHAQRNMVFHVREDREDWGRIAMCEEEGLIAVGTVHGATRVYGYA